MFVAIDEDGTAIELSCSIDMNIQYTVSASPNYGAFMLRTMGGERAYTTSWLVDGFFALPESEGDFTLWGYWWLADEWIVATGTRSDPSDDSVVLEYGAFIMRWDGSDVRRAPGRFTPDEDAWITFKGRTEDYAVYRTGPAPGGGFDFVRVDLNEETVTVLVENLGGTWVQQIDVFDPETGRFLIAGNPENTGRLYLVDIAAGTVDDLDVNIPIRVLLSTDGEYAVFSVDNGYASVSVLDTQNRHTYNELERTYDFVFEHDGHRFISRDDNGMLLLIDPSDGSVSEPLHGPILADARGVMDMDFALDGQGAYLYASFTSGDDTGLHYSDLSGSLVRLSDPARRVWLPDPGYASLNQSDDSRYVAYECDDGLFVADREGAVVEVPVLEDSESRNVRGWCGEWLYVEEESGSSVRMSRWRMGEDAVFDLTSGLGELLSGEITDIALGILHQRRIHSL